MSTSFLTIEKSRSTPPPPPASLTKFIDTGNKTTTDTTSPKWHLHIAVIWGHNKNNHANFEKNVQPLLLLTTINLGRNIGVFIRTFLQESRYF